MKKQLILIIILLCITLILNANSVKGLTTKDLKPDGFECIDKANSYQPSKIKTEMENQKVDFDRESWELIDSLSTNSYIQANNYWGVEYNGAEHTLAIITDQAELFEASLEAIAKSPLWVRPALENVLCQLSETNQLIWAELINNSVDPYIDEIAFSVAHSSISFLTSDYSNPQLFIDNAELLYSTEQDLSYVEIIDYGISSDEDYYSTTKYFKINDAGELVEIEVPKEIYYMYIVHPKITDEIPAYINENIVESNSTHQNNIVEPSAGSFWRDYLYNHNDAGYPLLKDALMQCSTAWSDSLETSNAIGAITDWIQESLEFTSGAERPHQPNRIYKKHIGRCGEHADITAAACRIALIPCNSILSISGDHTWNEFWDERWIHWEPVNNMTDVPFYYENEWDWSFASVFEIRSDGVLTPVTESYSDGISQITVYAFDSNGKAIDGGKILLAVQADSNIYLDNFGYTDNDGKYTFTVGEGKTYYARFDSEVGSYPPASNQVSQLVTNSVDGQTYTYSFNIDGTIETPNINEIDSPDDTIDDYKIVVDFSVPNQVIHGDFIMDDIDNSEFHAALDDGFINHFMTDQTNFDSYINASPFSAFNALKNSQDGTIDFSIPEYNNWYAFFNNDSNIKNPQHLNASIALYQFNPTNSDEQEIVILDKLQQNYPNPFNPSAAGRAPTTTIAFSVANDSDITEISIYNIKGQKVRSLVNEKLEVGEHKINWNGKNDQEKSVSSGIYYYQFKIGNNFSETKRMLLLK